MQLELNWQTCPGSLTLDNRDWCGIAVRPEATMCAVLDGSSSARGGGELAKELAQRLADWFAGAGLPVTPTMFNEQIRTWHPALRREFPFAAASLIVVVVTEPNHPVMALHAGDCIAGYRSAGEEIEWCTQPHTLANSLADVPIPQLAASPMRNRITRCFRRREFEPLEHAELPCIGDVGLVLATDGFWAGLPDADQSRMLAGEAQTGPPHQDDCSVLGIRFTDATGSAPLFRGTWENLYVVPREAMQPAVG